MSGPCGDRSGAQRHVLVVGLERDGAARQEQLGRRSVLVERPRPVVLHLVIVEDHQPREGGVRGLEVRVALVDRVAVAVGGNGHRFRAVVLPRQRRRHPVLVDVVAEEQHQVEILLRHVLVGGVEAHLEVLARGEREADPLGRVSLRDERAGAPDRAPLATHLELVPVPAAGLQAVDVDVHRVREVGIREGHAAAHDAAHVFVGRHVPVHGDAHGIDAAAAVRGERLDGQPRPQHDAVGQRIARGDAERERVGRERRRHFLGERLQRARGDEAGEPAGGIEKPASIELPLIQPGPKRLRHACLLVRIDAAARAS